MQRMLEVRAQRFLSRKVAFRVPLLLAKTLFLLTACSLPNAAALKTSSLSLSRFGRLLMSPERTAARTGSLLEFGTTDTIRRSVRLPLGEVVGMACPYNETVTQYYGIPFAEPVTGDARYTPPQMRSTPYPNSQLNATAYPPPCGCICSQEGQFNDKSAEDCLFLNIWVPPGASATAAVKLPVRVYIHGGNIMECSASDPEWNGCRGAGKSGMIHVNIQYRMGPFGLLAHPLLMEEFNTTGNWALLDQQLALRWVQENIGYFGGDPSKVVLNGHSKGGQLVDYHVIAPGSAGLFSAAISQSPSCVVLRTLEQAYNDSRRLMEKAGCAPLASPQAELDCMRTKPYMELGKVAETTEEVNIPKVLWCDRLSWQPTLVHNVDGTTIPQPLQEALEEGNFNKVPYLTGVTTAEAGDMVEASFQTTSVTKEYILEFLELMYPGADPEPILALYPLEHFSGAPDPMKAMFMSLWTDAMWSCPHHQRLVARRAGLQGTYVPTYIYYWGVTPSCPVERVYEGPYHASDLWFTFGNTEHIYCESCAVGYCSLNQTEKELSDTMLAAYTAMAETGVPRWQNGTAWAEWDEVNEWGTHINTREATTLRIGFKRKCTALLDAKQKSSFRVSGLGFNAHVN